MRLARACSHSILSIASSALEVWELLGVVAFVEGLTTTLFVAVLHGNSNGGSSGYTLMGHTRSRRGALVPALWQKLQPIAEQAGQQH